MSTHAGGSFEISMNAQPPYDVAPGATLSRMSITKRFEGDLTAVGQVEMLSAMTGVKGSAGYVAIERVTGVLHGRSGSFILQHSGSMTRGTSRLLISVVPDSGTDALEGIAGTMTIDIIEGRHRYGFDYTIDAQT